MGYYVDFKTISLEDLKTELKEFDMIPSWEVLLDDIDEKFDIFLNGGFKSVSDLDNELKSKAKISEFSANYNIDEHYLTILKRMIGGYNSKPIKLGDIPEITEKVLRKFYEIGIKNTEQLYPFILTNNDRQALASRLNISIEIIVYLASMTDLTRIRWVNQTFAYVLVKTGYDTIQKVVSAKAEDLYDKIASFNKTEKVYKGKIGIRDMSRLIYCAKVVPQEIIH